MWSRIPAACSRERAWIASTSNQPSDRSDFGSGDRRGAGFTPDNDARGERSLAIFDKRDAFIGNIHRDVSVLELRQPPPAFHIGGDLLRPRVCRNIQRRQRFASDSAILLKTVASLVSLDRIAKVIARWVCVIREICVFKGEPLLQDFQPRIFPIEKDLLISRQLRPAALGRDGAVVGKRDCKPAVFRMRRRQADEEIGQPVLRK